MHPRWFPAPICPLPAGLLLLAVGPCPPPTADLWQDDVPQLLLGEVRHIGLQVTQQHHSHVLLMDLKQLEQHRDDPRLEQGWGQQARAFSPRSVCQVRGVWVRERGVSLSECPSVRAAHAQPSPWSRTLHALTSSWILTPPTQAKRFCGSKMLPKAELSEVRSTSWKCL